MSAEYGRVLKAWALSALPEPLRAVRVISASADYYEGWGGSDITPGDDPELSIHIYYVDADGKEASYIVYGNEDNALRMTELLRELFRIADAE